MERLAKMMPVMIFFACWSWVGFGVPTPAQAATKTDTFQLKLTGKRWCDANPKFSEPFTVRINPKDPATNTILTIKRDPQNTGDLTEVQATINTHGGSADLDATTLNGEAFLTNKAGKKAEFVLSGVNPGNTDHFVTMRGQVTLDKLGNLTKATGTFMWRETSTYTIDKKTGAQSGPVECINSGTFVTNQKPAAGSGGGGGGGGGTLTVTNAPASVGGTFVANGQFTSVSVNGNSVGIGWGEFNANFAHAETVALAFDTSNLQAPTLIFAMADSSVGIAWICVPFDTPGYPTCNGVTINPSAGTVTLTDQVLIDNVTSHQPITLNGTLTFAPF
jgi:hypothetical protein